MNHDDELFFRIALNSTEPTACSPADPGPEWRGILIRAPESIRIAKGIFPVCGFYNVDMAELEDGRPITIFAIEQPSQRTYVASMTEEDHSPEEPEPELEPVDSKLLEGMSIGGYFNINLYDYLQLPPDSATYTLFVQYGLKQSNTVTVKLIGQQPAEQQK